MKDKAYLGLGSNLGDSRAILDAACEDLAGEEGLGVLRRSKTRRTAPVGGPHDQPDFWNGVLEIESELAPLDLLRVLHRIERAHGRRRESEERWGARTLDLDLLLYGGVISQSTELELPHPRMLERRFVMEPLAELIPGARLPGLGLSVLEGFERLVLAESNSTHARPR